MARAKLRFVGRRRRARRLRRGFVVALRQGVRFSLRQARVFQIGLQSDCSQSALFGFDLGQDADSKKMLGINGTAFGALDIFGQSFDVNRHRWSRHCGCASRSSGIAIRNEQRRLYFERLFFLITFWQVVRA